MTNSVIGEPPEEVISGDSIGISQAQVQSLALENLNYTLLDLT